MTGVDTTPNQLSRYSKSTPASAYSNTNGVFLQVTEITPQYSWKLSSVSLSKRLLDIDFGSFRGIFDGILLGFLCLLMKSSLKMNSINRNSSFVSNSNKLDSVIKSKKFKVCVIDGFTTHDYYNLDNFPLNIPPWL